MYKNAQPALANTKMLMMKWSASRSNKATTADNSWAIKQTSQKDFGDIFTNSFHQRLNQSIPSKGKLTSYLVFAINWSYQLNVANQEQPQELRESPNKNNNLNLQSKNNPSFESLLLNESLISHKKEKVSFDTVSRLILAGW